MRIDSPPPIDFNDPREVLKLQKEFLKTGKMISKRVNVFLNSFKKIDKRQKKHRPKNPVVFRFAG